MEEPRINATFFDAEGNVVPASEVHADSTFRVVKCDYREVGAEPSLTISCHLVTNESERAAAAVPSAPSAYSVSLVNLIRAVVREESRAVHDALTV